MIATRGVHSHPFDVFSKKPSSATTGGSSDTDRELIFPIDGLSKKIPFAPAGGSSGGNEELIFPDYANSFASDRLAGRSSPPASCPRSELQIMHSLSLFSLSSRPLPQSQAQQRRQLIAGLPKKIGSAGAKEDIRHVALLRNMRTRLKAERRQDSACSDSDSE